MGNPFSSTPDTKSTKEPDLQCCPWRASPNLDDSKYLSELKGRVEMFSLPPNLNVKMANILMLGPTNTGKSSFVKTINSIFQERITQPTTTGNAPKSLTMKYRKFLVRKSDNEKVLNFSLSDTSGLDPNGPPDLADLNYLVEGNVPDGYSFVNSAITPDAAGFKHQPEIQDKFHCVVFIFEASSVKLTHDGIWKKLNDLQLRMNSKDIPRIVLLTKIDKLSEEVKKNVDKVFYSKDVEGAVDYVSHRLGIPVGNVMPIMNYETENELHNAISCLAMQALWKMLGYATDYLVNQNDQPKQKAA